ncbi:MAG: hypothetical protein RLZZ306_2205 [Bacteroidota bacterium]|jgi:hypothetical protein
MKLNFLLTIFLLTSFTTFSQILPKSEPFVRCLSLQMTGKKRNVHFFEGDDIKVKLYSDHQKHDFQILRLTDSSFFYSPYNETNTIFDLQELKFKDIKKVYLQDNKSSFLLKSTGILKPAGVMLFTFDILNQLKNSTVKINPTIAGVSAGLVGVSYLVKILTNPNYRINKRHFFRIYHLPYSSPLLRE